MRKWFIGFVISLMVGVGLLAGPGLGSAQAGGTYAGCPYGAVCVYPDASFNHNPSLVFWSYGAHNLSNQIGMHRVFNNQYGGAHAWLCRNYNGVNCTPFPNGYPIEQYTYVDYDLTPINSILLTRN